MVRDLVVADEPEAMIAVMHRLAGRMAWRAAQCERLEECKRWSNLSELLARIQKDVHTPPESFPP